MTRQVLVQAKADITGCKQCGFFRDTRIFELCTHKLSEYVWEGAVDYHTCQHMRGNQCGAGMVLRPK